MFGNSLKLAAEAVAEALAAPALWAWRTFVVRPPPVLTRAEEADVMAYLRELAEGPGDGEEPQGWLADGTEQADRHTVKLAVRLGWAWAGSAWNTNQCVTDEGRAALARTGWRQAARATGSSAPATAEPSFARSRP